MKTFLIYTLVTLMTVLGALVLYDSKHPVLAIGLLTPAAFTLWGICYAVFFDKKAKASAFAQRAIPCGHCHRPFIPIERYRHSVTYQSTAVAQNRIESANQAIYDPRFQAFNVTSNVTVPTTQVYDEVATQCPHCQKANVLSVLFKEPAERQNVFHITPYTPT